LLSSGRRKMSGEVVESIRLLHERLERLELHAADQRARTSHSFIADHAKALKNYLEWEAMKEEVLSPTSSFLGVAPRPTKGNTMKKDELIQRMVKQFNKYWYDNTVKNIKFSFSWDHFQFLTLSEVALGRNEVLTKYFVSRPVILEPFAGCGADTISFLYNLNPKMILASDMAKKFEVDYIKRNVANFKAVFPHTSEIPVVLYNERASELLRRVKKEPGENHVVVHHIDFLYLDPPWVLPGTKQEATPRELLDFLMEEVFEPMRANSFVPKVIVIKTRFGEKDMGELMKMVNGFTHRDTLIMAPLRRTVHFHILTSNELTISNWKPSPEFVHVYRDGPEPELPPGDPQRAIDYGHFDYERSENLITNI
jgi:hypothetical protein